MRIKQLIKCFTTTAPGILSSLRVVAGHGMAMVAPG